MKKILVLSSAILLLAAACNNQEPVESAQNQQPKQNIPATPAAGWKTFKNSTYKFEIQYPSDWKIRNSPATVFTFSDSVTGANQQCSVSLTFGGSVSPKNGKVNNYSVANEGEKCGQILNQILASYKFTGSVSPATGTPNFACLPAGRTLSAPVSKGLTIEQNLMQLGGKCQNGMLVDSSGKQIVFYDLVGCWGNPPADYLQILADQQTQINQLKQNYTVITIACAGGKLIQ